MSSRLLGTDSGVVDATDIDDTLVALGREYNGSSTAVTVVDKDEDVMVDMEVVEHWVLCTSSPLLRS